MKKIFITFLVFNLFTFQNLISVPKTYSEDYLTIEDMFDINNLYEDHSGWKSQHASSYDMSEGNLDGQFFYKQQNICYTTTILEAEGPGVVTRFWTAGYAEDEERKVLHIYVDGKLLVEGKATDFFSGKIAPFIKPYVGYGSETGGGVYCYVPIVFSKSIKITAEYANYWNIDYTIFPADTKVFSTTVTPEPVLPSWYKSLSHDINEITDGVVLEGTKTIQANSSVVLFEDSTSGVVEGLNLVFDRLLTKNLSMEAFSASGRWIKTGGSISFDSYLNPNNNGAFLKYRIDAVWSNQVVDVFVDDVFVTRVDSGNGDTTYRYKDLYAYIPSSLTEGKTKVTVRLEAISVSGIDVPFLDIWLYSKTEEGTILSTYVDLLNGSSEVNANVKVVNENGNGTINTNLESDAFKINLNEYTYPENSESINKTVSVAKTNGTVSLKLNLSNDSNVILRRTTLASLSQNANVWVNGKRVGTWITTDAITDGICETYYEISKSSLVDGENIISFVSSNLNSYASIEAYQNGLLVDSVNFANDETHSLTGAFEFVTEKYSGVSTLKKEWETLKEEIDSAYDSFKLLDSINLRVYYGNDLEPSIDEPLSILLAVGKYNFYQTKSITQGIEDDGTCYFYLPMPYNNGIRIELVSTNEYMPLNSFKYACSYSELEDEYKENVQLLKVKTNHYEQTKEGEPLEWLNISGSGKLVGIEINATGAKSFEYLEGDEIVCVDGNKSHVSYGTGTEDIINSAWYFVAGSFTQAMHGAPTVGYNEEGQGNNSMYAWYLFNQFNFRDSIYATVEHGPQNLTHGENTYITAFYYHNDKSEMIKVCDIDIKSGITSSEIYSEIEGRLEGNYSNEYVTSRRRILEGKVTYEDILIPKNNNGIMIRRLFSLENVNQHVKVSVNGKYVGIWFNNYNRPADRILRYDDFIIPASYTNGKDKITIEFETLEDLSFDEVSYEVFAIGYDLEEIVDTDNDGIADEFDSETIIKGQEVIAKVSYMDSSSLSVSVSKSLLTDEKINEVISLFGNVKVLKTFHLSFKENDQEINLFKQAIVTLSGSSYENIVVVRVDEEINVIQVYDLPYLSFKTSNSGDYLVLYIK